LGTYGNFNAPRTFGVTLGYSMWIIKTNL
jgi:hypothetical protein